MTMRQDAARRRTAAAKSRTAGAVAAGLAAWHRQHKDDADYRAARAAGSRRRLAQLYRDAELGRLVREAFGLLARIVANVEECLSVDDGSALPPPRADARSAGGAAGSGGRKRPGGRRCA